ncbi:MAG: hypothetical protein OER88_08185, partial [Planctomycetota bacterium]|nr:hypothetical protein [Planctomycetota bacterium]
PLIMRFRTVLLLVAMACLAAAPDAAARGAAAGRGLAPKSDWRAWWDLNREHLVGFRHLLFKHAPLTGEARPERPDVLAGFRPVVRDELRKICVSKQGRSLRAAALLAMGRMGDEREALAALRVLHDRSQPADVHEAALLCIATLDRIGRDTVRDSVRNTLDSFVDHPDRLTKRTRAIAIMATGLRARKDRRLLVTLLKQMVGTATTSEDAAAIAFAAGLAGDAMLFPELLRGARTGKFAGVELDDVAHSHVVLALGRLADTAAATSLADLMRKRKLGVQTARATALGLGRLLAGDKLAQKTRRALEAALFDAFDKRSDVTLRGFCALALGGAREPARVEQLLRAFAKGGAAELRPYTALALGLAARAREGKTPARIRGVLAERLDKAKNPDFAAALCIALGLSGAQGARIPLVKRLRSTTLPSELRGAAAQGLGLLGRTSVGIESMVLRELENAPTDLIGDVALALGLIGKRSAGGALVGLLKDARSAHSRGKVIVAMGHLGHPMSAQPLFLMLEDQRNSDMVRTHCIVALGLLGDPRETDALFDIDAGFNYLATTPATRTLIGFY